VIAAFARSLLSGAVVSGTPLLYATLAEVIGERAGVVNLGLEGVMLVGAVTGFVTAVHTGSAAMGVLAAAGRGGPERAFAWLASTAAPTSWPRASR
jgi:simple sugar transport system permease protein